MELDSIKKVVDAEKKANEIKEKAMSEAQRIIQEAEKTKETSKLFYKRQLDIKLNELRQAQEQNAKICIEEIKARANQTVKKINERSKENMQKAVEEIFAKVVNI